MALEPASPDPSWQADDTNAPTLEFDFSCKGGDTEAFVEFLPTFRLYPGIKLRVAVSVDNGNPIQVEVPGSSGRENENGTVRSAAVQDNSVCADSFAQSCCRQPHVQNSSHRSRRGG
jgi:hypothetical protein